MPYVMLNKLPGELQACHLTRELFTELRPRQKPLHVGPQKEASSSADLERCRGQTGSQLRGGSL